MLTLGGCGTAVENTDWATQLSAEGGGASDEIQAALDSYSGALENKDRAAFLAAVDPENVDYTNRQNALYTNLEAVPFAQYSISVTSIANVGPDTVQVKVDVAYTLVDSFSSLPEPERAAYYLVRKESGWKISGDASEAALGKKRAAGLEDFGQVMVTQGQHVIVLSHPVQADIATEARDLADAAYPRLKDTLPGLDLPKVQVKVFDDMNQLGLAYPGGWQEWTGGASMPLGSGSGQGGEIIIDAETYREADSYSDGYNGRMLAHELTHIALFPDTNSRTPPFLVEGLADYVAGIEPVILLRQKLRSGESFSPTLRDLYQPTGFTTLLTTDAATLAYEESDLAVEYLEKTYGNEAVLRLLREFRDRGNESIDQDRLVDEVFREVLGVSWDEFENAWRSYVINA